MEHGDWSAQDSANFDFERIRTLSHELNEADKKIAELEQRIKTVIEAWELLGEGPYRSSTIPEWLLNEIKPAIDKLREK